MGRNDKDDRKSTNRWFNTWSRPGRPRPVVTDDWYWAPVSDDDEAASPDTADASPETTAPEAPQRPTPQPPPARVSATHSSPAPAPRQEARPETIADDRSAAFTAPERESLPELDDPELLSILDEDFAELGKEIERLTDLSPTWDKEKRLAGLLQLKDEWFRKIAGRRDQPIWRRRIEKALAEGMSRILSEGADVDMDGKVRFAFSPQVVQEQAKPIFDAVVEGLKDTVKASAVSMDLASGSLKFVQRPIESDEEDEEVSEGDLVDDARAQRRRSASEAIQASKRARRSRLAVDRGTTKRPPPFQFTPLEPPTLNGDEDPEPTESDSDEP